MLSASADSVRSVIAVLTYLNTDADELNDVEIRRVFKVLLEDVDVYEVVKGLGSVALGALDLLEQARILNVDEYLENLGATVNEIATEREEDE